MSLHKSRPDSTNPKPTDTGSTVMANGRHASPHAMIGDKPILGGLQNAIVEGAGRTTEENKLSDKQYHENRENMKKSQDKSFNKKTGEPKVENTGFGTDPVGDKAGNPNDSAPAAEVKKNVEAEKKAENVAEKKPEVKPVAPKVEEKPVVPTPVPAPVKVDEKK